MIGVEGIPEAGAAIDAFELGLMLPVPAQEKNTVVLEPRDGSNVQRLQAKAFELHVNNKKVMFAKEVKIDVFITDARVALACSKYDKGGGWIGGGSALVLNAGSKALAAVRRRGKMLVGHVRYPWLGAVGSTAKTGWLSEERLIFDAKGPGGELFRLTLLLPKNTDAARAAAEIARRAAAYRLAVEPELDGEERDAIEQLGSASPIAAGPGDDKNKIHFHRMPTFWPMSEKSARMIPGQPVAAEV